MSLPIHDRYPRTRSIHNSLRDKSNQEKNSHDQQTTPLCSKFTKHFQYGQPNSSRNNNSGNTGSYTGQLRWSEGIESVQDTKSTTLALEIFVQRERKMQMAEIFIWISHKDDEDINPAKAAQDRV
jgi:hypothetical protein